jgi:hypothetical protein
MEAREDERSLLAVVARENESSFLSANCNDECEGVARVALRQPS